MGGRFDHSDRARVANLTDKGGSVVLDLLAERVQPDARAISLYAIMRKTSKRNELLLQLMFSLGAHGAHPF